MLTGQGLDNRSSGDGLLVELGSLLHQALVDFILVFLNLTVNIVDTDELIKSFLAELLRITYSIFNLILHDLEELIIGKSFCQH